MEILKAYSLGDETNRPLAGPEQRRNTPTGRGTRFSGNREAPLGPDPLTEALREKVREMILTRSRPSGLRCWRQSRMNGARAGGVPFVSQQESETAALQIPLLGTTRRNGLPAYPPDSARAIESHDIAQVLHRHPDR